MKVPLTKQKHFEPDQLKEFADDNFKQFPHNYCQNNGQWRERNESCQRDYHQSTERILGRAKDQTNNLIISNPLNYKLNYTGLQNRSVYMKALGLTHYHPMLYYGALKIYSCGKHNETRGP